MEEGEINCVCGVAVGGLLPWACVLPGGSARPGPTRTCCTAADAGSSSRPASWQDAGVPPMAQPDAAAGERACQAGGQCAVHDHGHHADGTEAASSAGGACPPYGSKSVIGRRSKMEDACVAVPYLLEVPMREAGLDELLPPRIAPQLRSSSGTERTAEHGASAVGDSAAGPADAGAPADLSTAAAVETLHFFGVFDGHGGADAALHCAKTLHERVREVLTALTSPTESGASSSMQQQLPSPRSRGPVGPTDASGRGHECQSSARGSLPAGTLAKAPSGSLRGRESPAASLYLDAQTELATSNSSTSSSYLECDEDGEVKEGVSTRIVEGSCTTETVEAALSKAFHMTGEARSCLLCHSAQAVLGIGWP